MITKDQMSGTLYQFRDKIKLGREKEKERFKKLAFYCISLRAYPSDVELIDGSLNKVMIKLTQGFTSARTSFDDLNNFKTKLIAVGQFDSPEKITITVWKVVEATFLKTSNYRYLTVEYVGEINE